MSTFHAYLATLLADKTIDETEVPLLREHLKQDGRLDLNDVKLLVELYCQAHTRAPAFDELFFDVLEQVLLADGEIQPSEQFYLLKMLYSDREIRDREKAFLLKLQRAAKHATPEFNALCHEALQAHPTNWEVGGRC